MPPRAGKNQFWRIAMIKEIMVAKGFEKEEQPDGSYVDILDGYDGCQLQCPYCFQLNNPNWGKDILVRKNIIEVLGQQINNGENLKKDGELFIGSLSDPYMPLEGKYQLTRKMLQVLCDKDYDVRVTTKSDNQIILRDIDIMKSFKRPIRILMGLSNINQAGKGCDNVNIAIANELKKQGIEVWAFITPILPYIMKLDEMISSLDQSIPIYLDKLRIFSAGNQDRKMYDWVNLNFPQYKNLYYKLLFEQDESYYDQIVDRYKDNDRITFMFSMWNE